MYIHSQTWSRMSLKTCWTYLDEKRPSNPDIEHPKRDSQPLCVSLRRRWGVHISNPSRQICKLWLHTICTPFMNSFICKPKINATMKHIFVYLNDHRFICMSKGCSYPCHDKHLWFWVLLHNITFGCQAKNERVLAEGEFSKTKKEN